MRILLTGATGLLGGMLLYRWRHVAELIACVHEHQLVSDGFAVRSLDLLDPKATRRIIAETRPDWVCHAAAFTNVDACHSRPELARDLNIGATAAIAEAAATCGSRFLFISTDSVFDGCRGSYTEDDVPRPLNYYAMSKLEGENMTRRFLPDSLIVRTNIFGWNLQAKSHLAEWIVGRLRAGSAVPGWTDVFFTPICTIDLAEILMKMMSRSLRGTYHAGGSERCSKFEFARAVAATWTLNDDLVRPTTSDAAALTAARPKDTSLAVGKLVAAVGHELPAFTAGLQRMREWETSELLRFKKLLG